MAERMNKVVPTPDEADRIVMRAAGRSAENIDPVMRAAAAGGLIKVIRAMQALGWRITRPLPLVEATPARARRKR